MVFEIGPDVLDRIKLGCVRREILQGGPSTLGLDIRPDQPRAVRLHPTCTPKRSFTSVAMRGSVHSSVANPAAIAPGLGALINFK
jgi:hypothetical protein